MAKKASADTRKQVIHRRIWIAVSSARLEGLEVTATTMRLMLDVAADRISSEKAIETIVALYVRH